MPARRAEATWKACRAIELMLEGRTYDQIAQDVGFANRGTAHRVVTQALADRLAEDIDVLRELEVARLDALQYSLWAKAENGDVRAVNSVLRIIDRRCRLLGLYGAPTAAAKPLMTLVMRPEELADHDAGNTGEATGATIADPA